MQLWSGIKLYSAVLPQQSRSYFHNALFVENQEEGHINLGISQTSPPSFSDYFMIDWSFCSLPYPFFYVMHCCTGKETKVGTGREVTGQQYVAYRQQL